MKKLFTSILGAAVALVYTLLSPTLAAAAGDIGPGFNVCASCHTSDAKMTETMNDTQLDAAIAARPHPKVTKEAIEARIKAVDYTVLPNSTVTICNISLENGFSVRGESACVDARNFNMQIGQEIAYRNAFAKLWELEGYLLAENRWRSMACMAGSDSCAGASG